MYQHAHHEKVFSHGSPERETPWTLPQVTRGMYPSAKRTTETRGQGGKRKAGAISHFPQSYCLLGKEEHLFLQQIFEARKALLKVLGKVEDKTD